MGREGQWDSDVSGGTRESRGHPKVPLGLWDGKDGGTVMFLLGHVSSRGHPTVPLGLWDRKEGGTVMSLLGHVSSRGHPTVGWEGRWDCDVSVGTRES